MGKTQAKPKQTITANTRHWAQHTTEYLTENNPLVCFVNGATRVHTALLALGVEFGMEFMEARPDAAKRMLAAFDAERAPDDRLATGDNRKNRDLILDDLAMASNGVYDCDGPDSGVPN